MSYYDSLHEPPSEVEVGLARDALARARSAAHQSSREGAYIAAAGEIFRGYPDVPRIDRDRNYSSAMATLAANRPDDDEASVFHALSLLALARRGEAAKLVLQAATILERLFDKLPEHPGVAHYLIHAYDDSGNRRPGIAAARRYAGIAPLMTHAQHMPSHIFAGLGMWEESNASNEKALEANPRYYHALMYLVYGHLQLGRWRLAEARVDKLRSFAAGAHGGRAEQRGLHSVNTRLLLETRAWQAAVEAPAYSQAALDAAETLYVRGIGAAHTGKLQLANASLSSLHDMLTKLDQLDDSGVASRTLLIRIQSMQLEALIAYAEMRYEKAITILRQAAAIEDGPGVDRAPPDAGTGLPTREVLGELLFELKRYSEAQQEFEMALERTPNRLHSVLGLARAAARAADEETARRRYGQLIDLLADADPELGLTEEAKKFLEHGI